MIIKDSVDGLSREIENGRLLKRPGFVVRRMIHLCFQ